jgi:methionine synthase I (cobalamin-dependent)
VSYARLRPRLFRGRPLIVDSDVAASLGARGCSLEGPGSLGAALYESEQMVREHHLAELRSRVDILCALTSVTTPRALAESGMEHRAARLTGRALELLSEIANESTRPVAVAGVLAADQLTATHRERFEEETAEHAARIAVGGAELIIVRATGSRLDLVFSVAAAAAQELAVWAVLDPELATCNLNDLLGSLSDAGAEAVLFEVSSVDQGLQLLERAARCPHEIIPGALLSAATDAVRGFPCALVPGWVDRVVELTDAGARIVGGGAGTTEAHTQELAVRLGYLHPSIAPSGRAHS